MALAYQVGNGGVTVDIHFGSGDPTAGGGEAANLGSIYLRSNGLLYWKSGAANTAWSLIPSNVLFTSALNGLVGAMSVAHPARALNTTFQPSATRPVLLIYSVRIESTISIAGGQSGRVELVADAGSPPTTVQARIAGGATGTAVVGLSVTDTMEGDLPYLCPEGHNVRINTVDETGTPTYTLQRVTEITL